MSEKIYAFLLRFYPAAFREMYGEEALQLFRDRARDEKGVLAGLRLWMELLVDFVFSMTREHLNAQPAMDAATGRSIDGMPSFWLLESESPRPAAIVLGGLLTLAAAMCGFFLPVSPAKPSMTVQRAESGYPQMASKATGSDGQRDSNPSSVLVLGPAEPGKQGKPTGETAKPDDVEGGATVLMVAGAGRAQAPVTFSFEVVTIKESQRKSPNPTSLVLLPGRFAVTNMTVKQLIEIAYNIDSDRDERITGGPDWISTTQFDIDAKTSEATITKLLKLPVEEQAKKTQEMLQELLIERFKLVVHHENKAAALYSLDGVKTRAKRKSRVNILGGERLEDHIADSLVINHVERPSQTWFAKRGGKW
ncbi:MAG TPA: TIGR03435 family protein [Edaphobacter sp.]|nr:TIGR03435 family protein [Edaphobacter sp.]